MQFEMLIGILEQLSLSDNCRLFKQRLPTLFYITQKTKIKNNMMYRNGKKYN